MSSEEDAIKRMTSPEAFARWLAWHIPLPLQRRPAELAIEPEALGSTIEPGKPQRFSRSAIARLRRVSFRAPQSKSGRIR